jgi:translocation and assembly module TamA
LGCVRPTKVPGETDIAVSSVTIEGPDAAELPIDTSELVPRLGMRSATLTLTNRYFSDFRVAEDRRRIAAFFQNFGYFYVVVDEPRLEFEEQDGEQTVAVHWTVRPGERYRVGRVALESAPAEYDSRLRKMIPFETDGEDIDLEAFRKVRNDMGDMLRREGYSHANVYSRAFVDRVKRRIHWYYYVDIGPLTRVGTIQVQGAVKVPAELVLERTGLRPGEPLSLEQREIAEFDLLDTGAYNSAFVRANADVKFIVPGTAPDTGGELKEEQISADGKLIPRTLSPDLDVIVHVVEAPSEQLRLRAGAEFDPERFDTNLSGRFWFRNLFGPLHHLVVEGLVGYGWLWNDTRDANAGVYGEALLRTEHPGAIGRLGDMRMSARYRYELYPGYHLGELTVGPGIRTSFARGASWDADLYFRLGQQVGFGAFDEQTRSDLALATDELCIGPELTSSIVWDRRDNLVEPMSGHLLALRATFGPGPPIGTHRYLTVLPEARELVPLTSALSLALRASAGWTFFAGDEGVPLGARLFGGGAFGFRGNAAQYLSPRAMMCQDPPASGSDGEEPCVERPVGGLSLVETSVELRLLPPLKQFGAITFVDFGGAGPGLNPFELGPSLAAGLGLRLRLWYLPMAIDVAYRILGEGAVQPPDSIDTYGFFFRMGEAF